MSLEDGRQRGAGFPFFIVGLLSLEYEELIITLDASIVLWIVVKRSSVSFPGMLGFFNSCIVVKGEQKEMNESLFAIFI